MPAPEIILKLVEQFKEHRDSYKSGNYNETQLRREFLDPFFKALGWDIANEQSYAAAYKDVIHEDVVRIGSFLKAPDYSFRIGGNRKFFLEAKNPSIDIKNDGAPAFQLRRYGFSAKLPLSILSNFAEFAVYDCRFRPRQTDRAATNRIFYCTFAEFTEKWDWIAAVFSREAVLRGGYDKYAESTRAKRGTTEVDHEFLADIENWRDLLARNLALRNPQLSVRDLNFAVQRTIDRIIFLRICEDRGIEPYGRLQAATNGTRAYLRICELFQRADDRYNSGLFHFKAEKGRLDTPDELSLTLTIDDSVIKEIVGGLYYPDSPYEFSVLSADILGQVYEQFLGKVIRLTDGHQAKVEEKPAVRKAGGVYYTPVYIVDYLVKNTLGRRLGNPVAGTSFAPVRPLHPTPSKANGVGIGDGEYDYLPEPESMTPKQAAKLRVLDPACGSGSFLIQAYQFLLDWHRDWYAAHEPEKWAKGKNPVLCQGRGGEWRLTMAERKRILLDNIYGVDIDAQAVEVTKLSLLLKVLEGENEQSVANQLLLFHERALPDLERNIKCGNSLIGADFYSQPDLPSLDSEERLRVNVFDWNGRDGFPEVMKDGGFDVVLGNPPYIRIQVMKEWAPVEVEFYKDRYQSASSGNYDIYVVFVERCLELLRARGRLGFILPHKFFNAKYGAPLRNRIASGNHLEEVVHFGDQQIFANATTYTCLLFLNRSAVRQCEFRKVSDLEAWIQAPQATPSFPVTQEKLLTSAEWNFSDAENNGVLQKIAAQTSTLGDVAHLFVGLQTSADRIYVVPAATDIEDGLTQPFLLTGELAPYSPAHPSAKLIFPYELRDGKALLLPGEELAKRFPKGWAYLCEHRQELMKRDGGTMRHRQWHAFGRSQNLTAMAHEKLIIQVTAKRPTVLFDDTGLYMTGGGSGPFYGIRPKSDGMSIKWLLGILNSNVFGYWVKKHSTNLRGGYIKFSKQYIESAPIPAFRAQSPEAKRLVELVELMLTLHQQLSSLRTPHEKTAVTRQIAATEAQLNQLVYDLYGLSKNEIQIVEDATA